jgi:hypothetical protein
MNINEIEYIIENINFTMSMEDMPLTVENKYQLREGLKGKIDFDKLITQTITKYKKESA